MESEVFSRESAGRCAIKFTVINRNIQLLLTAKSSDDQSFCWDEGIRIADVLNNPSAHLSYLPEMMQFASASVASASVASGELVQTDRTSEGTGSGATTLAALSIVFCISAVISVLFI